MRKILSVFVLVSVVVTGCAKKEVVEIQPVEIRPDVSELPVNPAAFKTVALEPAWSAVVPIRQAERLDSIRLTGNRLYAFSNNNYVVSMDRAERDPIISFSAAPAGFVINGWDISGENLYSIISSELIEIDRNSGTKVRSQRLGFAPVCPAARNSMFYYIAGTDRRLHAFGVSDMVEVFDAAAGDDAEMTDVIADDDLVIFATHGGLISAMLPDKRVQLWKFSATRKVNAPLVKDAGTVFFSSEDTYVYAIDARRGRLIWKYRTAALLKDAPRVTKRYIYQYAAGQGLLALEKTTGELAWRVDNGRDLLAETKSGIYIIDEKGDLVLVNANNGKKIGSVAMPAVSLYTANTTDEKIYLADKFGRVICLQSTD